jgi:hypothetical protein
MRFCITVVAIMILMLGMSVQATSASVGPRCGFPSPGDAVCRAANTAVLAQAEFYRYGRSSNSIRRDRAFAKMRAHFTRQARHQLIRTTQSWPEADYDVVQYACICSVLADPSLHTAKVSITEAWIVGSPSGESMFKLKKQPLSWKYVFTKRESGEWVATNLKQPSS